MVKHTGSRLRNLERIASSSCHRNPFVSILRERVGSGLRVGESCVAERIGGVDSYWLTSRSSRRPRERVVGVLGYQQLLTSLLWLELLSRLLLNLELLRWLLLELVRLLSLLERELLGLLKVLLLEVLRLLEILSLLLLQLLLRWLRLERTIESSGVVLHEGIGSSGLWRSTIPTKSSTSEGWVDLSWLLLLLKEGELLRTSNARSPWVERRLLHQKSSGPLQVVALLRRLELAIVGHWSTRIELLLRLRRLRIMSLGSLCLHLALYISIICIRLHLRLGLIFLALLEHVATSILLEVRIVQVLLQGRSQRSWGVLDRRNMQFSSILKVLGHTQVVNNVLGLVDKLDVHLQCPLGVVARHFKVVLQKVNHTLVELLEQRQKVIHQ